MDANYILTTSTEKSKEHIVVYQHINRNMNNWTTKKTDQIEPNLQSKTSVIAATTENWMNASNTNAWLHWPIIKNNKLQTPQF